jgi:hypothetical protein
LEFVVYPLRVETKFTLSGTNTVVEPSDTWGAAWSAARLVPGAWNIEWAVKRPDTDPKGNPIDPSGFSDLEAANLRNNDPWYKALAAQVSSSVGSPAPTPSLSSGNKITLDLSSYTGTVGNTGSANFNLTYVPFSLNESAKWTVVKSAKFSDMVLDEIPLDGIPHWIIRNGVNDAPQDGNTTFDSNSTWDGTANGNGAVAFTVAEPVETAGPLAIRNGKFLGDDPAETDPDKVKIRFTTTGYTGTAEAYYVVESVGYPAPAGYAAYTNSLGQVSAGKNHEKTITISSFDANTKYYIYVILVKDGTMTKPLKISTQRVFIAGVGRQTKQSDDSGKTWTASSAPGARGVYGDGVFVLVYSQWNNNTSKSYAIWSEDEGGTWATVTVPMPDTASCQDVDYGDGVFVTVAEDSNIAVYSEDGGKTWTPSAPLPSSGKWYTVTYGDGVFVAATVGRSNLATEVAWSGDGGRTWTGSLDPPSSSVYSMAYGGGVFVGVHGDTAARSVDGGKTWEEVSLPSPGTWEYVTYGDGVFVMISATNSSKAAYSKDGGKTWTTATLPSIGSGSFAWGDVAYGNGVFVTVPRGPLKAAYSEDGGETWKEASLPVSAFSSASPSLVK